MISTGSLIMFDSFHVAREGFQTFLVFQGDWSGQFLSEQMFSLSVNLIIR